MTRGFLRDFFVGVLFGCVILAVLWRARPWEAAIPSDFLIHYQASERLLNRQSPYIDWQLSTLYNYSPTIFPFIFWFSFFELRDFFVIWQAFSVLSLLASAILITKIVRPARTVLGVRQGRSLLCFLAFLVFFPTRFGLLMGQINNFVLLALSLFFYCFFEISPNPSLLKRGIFPFNKGGLRGIFVNNQFLAGFWLAIAVFLKLTPVIFVPYLFLKGRKEALVSFFSVAILIFLISGAFFGFAQYVLWWQDLKPALFSIFGKSIYYNQALSGLAARVVGENRVGFMLTLFLETTFLITTFSFILMFNFLRRRVQNDSGRKKFNDSNHRIFLEISLLLTTMLLVNRLSWQHHLVWVLPAFVFSVCCFVKEKQWLPLALSGVCFLLLNHNIPLFRQIETQPLSWIYLSHGTMGLLGLWGLLIREMSSKAPAEVTFS